MVKAFVTVGCGICVSTGMEMNSKIGFIEKVHSTKKTDTVGLTWCWYLGPSAQEIDG